MKYKDQQRILECANVALELGSIIELPEFTFSTRGVVQWFPGTKAKATKIVKLLGGKWEKSPLGDELMEFKQMRGDVELCITIMREKVCERVVVGVETVEEEIPDPDVEVPEVPMVKVVREVEKVEWQCHGLLAGASA